MKQKPKRRKSIIVRLLVLGVAAYFIVTSITEVNKLVKLKNDYDELNNQKQMLELDIKELKALLDSDSHNEIIEKAARERLGFVYSDEEVFVDISGN